MAPLHPEIRKFWEDLGYKILDDKYLGPGSQIKGVNLKNPINYIINIAYVHPDGNVVYISLEDIPPPYTLILYPKWYSEKDFLKYIKNKPPHLKAFW